MQTHHLAAAADAFIERAIEAARRPGGAALSTLDDLPAAIYVTDAQGVVVYFNHACVAFAGRTPIIGQDRWCVSWKLFTDGGEFLPHDAAPLAKAIRKKRPVRGLHTMAERPDGSRVHMLHHPTPLFSDNGELVGAVNLLLDVTHRKQAAELRRQAERCRRLANLVGPDPAGEKLNRMAADYDDQAHRLDHQA